MSLDHIAEQLRPLAVPVADLALDPGNARRHPERNLDAIRASLQRFGQRLPLVVQRAGMIVRSGNGRLVVARQLGWTHMAAVVCDDEDAIAQAFGLADNRTAELAEWDEDQLAKLLGEVRVDPALLDAVGFSMAEADEMLFVPPDADPDAVPDAPAVPITRTGDLWELGGHRLLCGDSTKSEDVQRVMLGQRAGLMNTDPPYGVAYKNDDRPNPGRVATPRVANDELHDEALQAFLEAAFGAAKHHALADNAAWYLWHAHLTQGFFAAAAAAAAAAAVILHRQIIWVKPHLLLTFGQYHWRHEPCFMGWVQGHQPPDYGAGAGERTQTTVWEIDGVSQQERKTFNHSTPKPVGLFEIPLVKHLKHGEIAFEPFAGTGPQFIAAEKLGRRCFGIELEPSFCDVILRRWAAFSGGDPVRHDGARWSELATP